MEKEQDNWQRPPIPRAGNDPRAHGGNQEAGEDPGPGEGIRSERPEHAAFETWLNENLLDDGKNARHASDQLLAYVRRRDIGFPELFEFADFDEKSFERINVKYGAYPASITRWIDNPRVDGMENSLLLTGAAGVGKTHLMIAALKRFVRYRKHPKFVDYRVLLDDCRGGWDTDPIGDYRAIDVLGIDEFGAIEGSRAQVDRVATIMALRMSDNRPTVITGNLKYPGEFRDILDDRLISRMNYHYKHIEFFLENFREIMKMRAGHAA